MRRYRRRRIHLSSRVARGLPLVPGTSLLAQPRRTSSRSICNGTPHWGITRILFRSHDYRTRFERDCLYAPRFHCSARESHARANRVPISCNTVHLALPVSIQVYRLERKKALRCVKRISNANIFEAAISRKDAQRRLIDELLALFGGGAKLVMAHLVESGELTLDDVKEAEKALRKPLKKEKSR